MARRMSRPTRAILLMLALVWQTAALLTPWVSSHWVSELEHMAVHSQGNGHHHHDDLSLHMDDNDTSLVHQHADSSTGSIGLWQHTELHVLPGAPHGVQMFAGTAVAELWATLVEQWLARVLSR